MSKETKLNIFAKNKTVLNTNGVDYPKFSLGMVIDNKYQVEDKIGGNSGEADLYIVNHTNSSEISSQMVLKLYRRKDSIKSDVLDSLISIKNENVAEIIDYGSIDGYQYIVIPYYQNGSLASYIESGNLFDLDAIKTVILPSIADGLKAIHEKGIIHKDVKPSNLMVSNDQKHIVLIDFGISSTTKGNTVVVTQTGKSPFYSAPETTTGLYLAGSDYYSLGITLYELVTGYTPYQNATIENIARFAQIQKIPYPEGFNQELADLIDGLTYKDISNRHEKSNPNRRWGYEEISDWLSGKKLPKPGYSESAKVDTFTNGQNVVPYIFKGEKIYRTKNIILAFLKSWNEGKKEVFRGFLTRHFEIIEDTKSFELCQNVMNKETVSGDNLDQLFLKLMYLLEPSIDELYWKNYNFANLTEFGNELINQTLNCNSPSISNLTKSAEDFIKNRVLETYLETHPSDINNILLHLLKSFNNLISTKEFDPRFVALKLGHTLTGREEFKIGGKKYNNIQEFNSYIDELYASNFVAFIDYCKAHNSDIELCNLLFSEKITVHLKKPKEAIEFDGYVFKNEDDLLRYYFLLNNDKYEWLNTYKNSLKSSISKIKDKSVRKKILDSLELSINSIDGIVEVGNTVKFGNYWQRNEEQKDPIEWIVLDVKNRNGSKKALLLSKYALEQRPYHPREIKITWEECAIRQWLNTEFLNNAFTMDEQDQIITSKLHNYDNQAYGTRGGNDTKDKIFLLSIDECNKYIERKANHLYRCTATEFASRNAYSRHEYVDWWLRSPGDCRSNASFVMQMLRGYYWEGCYLFNDKYVRMAMWINLE